MSTPTQGAPTAGCAGDPDVPVLRKATIVGASHRSMPHQPVRAGQARSIRPGRSVPGRSVPGRSGQCVNARAEGDRGACWARVASSGTLSSANLPGAAVQRCGRALVQWCRVATAPNSPFWAHLTELVAKKCLLFYVFATK